MMDPMFELPSNNERKLHIDINYAKQKLEKVDLKILKAS